MKLSSNHCIAIASMATHSGGNTCRHYAHISSSAEAGDASLRRKGQSSKSATTMFTRRLASRDSRTKVSESSQASALLVNHMKVKHHAIVEDKQRHSHLRDHVASL
jgi:hypothetical protein